MSTAKRYGAATQRFAAEYARAHGWPYAQAKGAGEGGRDIENMPGISPEVKGVKEFSPTGSLRQAVKNANGDLPIVIYRPRGYGPERIADWPAVLRYADLVRLLRAAGYGNPQEGP